MNQYIEYFTNYIASNYDMNNNLIKLKYFHSLRVAWLMNLIANKLNLNNYDTLLAFKLGLCHDLGRFYEVILNGKFNNLLFDHGSYSNKILYNDKFINYMDINEHLLFRKAIYCHNKKELTNNLNHREMFFANMLRDADKIDILNIRSNGSVMTFDEKPTKEVIDNYLNNDKIDINSLNNNSDSVILYLSFIKDLTQDVSKDIATVDNCLINLLKIIKVNDEQKDLFSKILDKLDNKGEKVYVR